MLLTSQPPGPPYRERHLAHNAAEAAEGYASGWVIFASPRRT